MTRRVSAIADAGYILVLPTNFIVLVSSGFRVAHISAEGKTSQTHRRWERRIVSRHSSSRLLSRPSGPNKWSEKFDPIFLLLTSGAERRMGAPAGQRS